MDGPIGDPPTIRASGISRARYRRIAIVAMSAAAVVALAATAAVLIAVRYGGTGRAAEGTGSPLTQPRDVLSGDTIHTTEGHRLPVPLSGDAQVLTAVRVLSAQVAGWVIESSVPSGEPASQLSFWNGEGQLRAVATATGPAVPYRVSPDGTVLVVGGNGTVTAYELPTGRQISRTKVGDHRASIAGVTTDRAIITREDFASDLGLWDWRRNELTPLPEGVRTLDLSSRGSPLVISRDPQRSCLGVGDEPGAPYRPEPGSAWCGGQAKDVMGGWLDASGNLAILTLTPQESGPRPPVVVTSGDLRAGKFRPVPLRLRGYPGQPVWLSDREAPDGPAVAVITETGDGPPALYRCVASDGQCSRVPTPALGGGTRLIPLHTD